MDDIQRLYRESPGDEGPEPEDRDSVHCENATCRTVFVVEHVGGDAAWTCPSCKTAHPNLHLHFIVLGAVTAFLALVSFALLVLFLALKGREAAAVPFVIWSAVQISLASYVLLAVFGDRRAYGLASLRVLIPLVFLSTGGFIEYVASLLWMPLALIAAPVVLAAWGYLGWVFRHAFRMAEMHRPREAVVRPMYTLISITVHVILLTLFTSLFIYEQRRTPGTSSIEFGRPGGYVPSMRELEELEELEEEKIEPEEEKIEPELEELEIPLRREAIEYQTENEIAFHKVEPEEKPRMRQRRRMTHNERYQQRYNRDFALELGGGTDSTEAAVLRALRWLKSKQNADGSWGQSPLQPSMTGLALLCFLGHGEDHLSDEFGATVRSGIEWLIGNQDSEGFLAHERWPAYQHGIATYAMSEAYAMTELERIRPVVQRAVEVILHGQTDEGGWYYGYAKGGIMVTEYHTGRQYFKDKWPGGDTSISAWQIQALTAAWYARIRFPNRALANARRNALSDIKSRIDSAGGWSGYQDTAPNIAGDNAADKRSNAYALTAAATLCLQFLGDGGGTEARALLSTMRRYSFDWERTKGGWRSAPLYAWYYVTQAKFHAAGAKPTQDPVWARWNRQMTETLLREQNDNGSWDFPAKSMEGKELVEGTKNKPVYSTTLCCLMLEVYYRYLPTYRTH